MLKISKFKLLNLITIKIFKFLIILFIFLTYNYNVYAAESKVYKVAAFNNYPVIFQDTDGVIKGFYVDLLTEIGNKEKIKFEYILGTWGDGLNRIKTGEVDMLTSVGYNYERSLYMDYTKNPILTVWGDLYALDLSNINNILDVEGKNIAVMKDDINAKNFLEMSSKFNITYKTIEYNNYDDVFKAISEKQVDAGIAGITFGLSNQGKYNLKSTGIIFNPLNLYFTTSKDKNQDLIQILDLYLSSWKKDSTSVYFLSKEKWMSGIIQIHKITPSWVINIIIVLIFIVIISSLFIYLLKYQVNKEKLKVSKSVEELKNSVEKYRSLFDNMTNGFAFHKIIKDKNGKFVNYEFLEVNDVFEKMVGLQREKIIGKKVTEVIPGFENDKANWISTFGNIALNGKGKIFESYSEVFNKWFTISVYSPKKEYFATIFEDITDKKNKEILVIENKNRNDAILNSIGDAVFACDNNDNIILFNKTAELLTGKLSKDVIGKNYKKIVILNNKITNKPSYEFIEKSKSSRMPTQMSENIMLVDEKGSLIPVADSASPIIDDNGNIIGFVVVFRDITEEYELDSAKNEFVSITSHQFRTPLSATKWVLETLFSDSTPTLKQKEKYNYLTISNNRLIKLVNNMLSVSRIEAGKLTVNKEFIDIQNIVDALKTSVKNISNKYNKKIIFNLDPKIKSVYCDLLIIHEILENLLANAIEYSNENSEIIFKTEERKNDYLVSVHNDGYIKPESAEKIKNFGKFVRGIGASEIEPAGSGLGLYICKKLIEASGGTIWFESNSKLGTTFYITIIKK